MAIGFKRDGKFHPTSKSKGVSRSSRVRYANDTGSSRQINEGVKAFASKIKKRHQEHQARQREDFNKEIAIRRKFEGKLIIAFRLGRSQGIDNSRKMEKFIRTQIPNLPDDKETNKFVVRVLKDFLEREKVLEKNKKGKGEDEKKALQTEFDDSLKKSKELFEQLQADEDKELALEQAQFKKEIEADEAERERETKQKEKDARKAEQDVLDKLAKDEKDRKEKEEKLKADAKKAEQDAKQKEADAIQAEKDAKQKQEDEEKQKSQQEAEQKENEAREAEIKAKEIQEELNRAEKERQEKEQRDKIELEQAKQKADEERQKIAQENQKVEQEVVQELKKEENKIESVSINEDVGFPEGII